MVTECMCAVTLQICIDAQMPVDPVMHSAYGSFVGTRFDFVHQCTPFAQHRYKSSAGSVGVFGQGNYDSEILNSKSLHHRSPLL